MAFIRASQGGGNVTDYIPDFKILGIINGNYICCKIPIDCTKFNKLNFTTVVNLINWTSGVTSYFDFRNSTDSIVANFTKNSNNEELTLNSSWGIGYIYLYARAASADASFEIKNIVLS